MTVIISAFRSGEARAGSPTDEPSDVGCPFGDFTGPLGHEARAKEVRRARTLG
ncbi:hypothetical protein [Streptomyces sp. NBC_00690]|uniref:hypothetical protein n=1 Tax=Streptomyces sp. NBC_00690 TaxID=2975808 RepID=UPI002E299360|nr:hypothetical protein [Streptomyces sp. NBC_00690]